MRPLSYVNLKPLISLLHNRSTAKQCWFADDATGAGSLEEVKQWWDELREAGRLPIPRSVGLLLSRKRKAA